MVDFNSEIKKELQLEINRKRQFNVIVLWGKIGSGKTNLIHNVLQNSNIVVNDIIFSTESFFPLGTFSYEEWRDSNESDILMNFTQKLYIGECLLFQNMENCGKDYKKLIFRLLQQHKNAQSSVKIILEYNVNRKPIDDICEFANCVISVKESDDTFYNYLNYYFQPHEANKALFYKIILMADKNIENFFSILAILQHLNIIYKDREGCYEYKKTNYDIPDNMLNLYIKVIDELDNHLKEPIFISAPLSICIYEKLIHSLFVKYGEVEEYLDILCKKDSLLSYNENNAYMQTNLFQSSYIFSTEEARKAVLAKLGDKAIYKSISEYYNYFDRIYSNPEIYENLQDSDKLLLLHHLAKIRKNRISLNQIKYIVDIMNFYYTHFMYFNAIEQGKTVIESKLLNATQLNNESHDFWVLYLNSLIAVGNYKCIISYKNQFKDADLNYLIAMAEYQNGNPLEALQILNAKMENNNQNIGYKYSLMASIYDWIGDNKNSYKFFMLALKCCDNEPGLKYQLYKKYNIYVDFRIPQCQEKMQQAINYYETRELKQYAECLHNFGTSCIFIFNYKEAQHMLKKSVDVLYKVCSNEIYYSLNSLAILNCYEKNDYVNAINLWKQALNYDINIDFCEMAIHNNMFNTYIKMGKLDLAKQQKNYLERMFLDRCNSLKKIKKEKPDIQHQLRQFFYNCGMLLETQHCYSEALEAFIKARKCSFYDSVIIYSINCHIEDNKQKLRKQNRLPLSHDGKRKGPTPTERFIYDNKMYLCEIMFWE